MDSTVQPVRNVWIDYYIGRATQGGGGRELSPFVGTPYYQRGYGLGGIFAGIASIAKPILGGLIKDLGGEVLKTGVGIASDVLTGKDTRKSVEERAEKLVDSSIRLAKKRISNLQAGGGCESVDGSAVAKKHAGVAKANHANTVQLSSLQDGRVLKKKKKKTPSWKRGATTLFARVRK
ncbi:MAG: hypothetical protein GY696_34815 [Gammaproteobacteria bacterium]|nr:hypothetical protein [Gammaproteobacteria bacterium]